MYLATPSQMKAAEANAVAAGETYIGLMENAGAAAVQELCRCVDINADSRVLIICGRGNNGGDGFVMARLIADMGARGFVTLPCGAPKSGIALEEYAKIDHSKITFLDTDDERISDRYDAVVDAVFGTGFHGELSADIISLFSRISKDSFILAADIPSGADSVTGKVSAGTLMCGLTITFGAPKIGMTLLPAQINCGKIIVREIGITESCFENTGAPIMMTDAMAEKCVPARGQRKYERCGCHEPESCPQERCGTGKAGFRPRCYRPCGGRNIRSHFLHSFGKRKRSHILGRADKIMLSCRKYDRHCHGQRSFLLR